MKHWPQMTASIYEACLTVLARPDDVERRESILSQARLWLPIPVEWSVNGCPSEFVQRLAERNGDSDVLPKRFVKRCFKPLLYTDTGLYCTAMPVQTNPNDAEDLISPGDGLVIRPVQLGLLLIHVTASVPPSTSLQSVEYCVSTCAL
ncbi:hypothetical protein D915_003365 [Fasciola hepatica]|uniref:Uncharacterized protein n=1 Tax=Fasciola hepatica TaxID=6192 RepID=A0A4E0S0P6_FASHE|nr:hypothetical protein D915_003365 [Fasciola hepatica]